MRLVAVQERFKRFLFDCDASVAAVVVDTPHLDARDRLQIYANGYRSRLVDVVSADFPAVRAFVGEDAFAELSGRYIKAYPSRSFTLRGFGARLPQFIESETDLPDRAFLAELARFEWALVEAFDAPDEPVATADDAARIPRDVWPRLGIDVHPSLRVIDLRFSTLTVWNSTKDGRQVPPPTELPAATACLVWRGAQTTKFRSLERVELTAWSVLVRSDFSAMCESLLEWLTPEEIGPRAASLLRTWLDDGLIGSLRAP